MYFPDDNSEKYPGILYPGDMTVYRATIKTSNREHSSRPLSTTACTAAHDYDDGVCLIQKDPTITGSDVARAFPDGRVAHPENQNEEKNK